MSDTALDIGVGDSVTIHGVGDAIACHTLREGIKAILAETQEPQPDIGFIKTECVSLLCGTKSILKRRKKR